MSTARPEDHFAAQKHFDVHTPFHLAIFQQQPRWGLCLHMSAITKLYNMQAKPYRIHRYKSTLSKTHSLHQLVANKQPISRRMSLPATENEVTTSGGPSAVAQAKSPITIPIRPGFSFTVRGVRCVN